MFIEDYVNKRREKKYHPRRGRTKDSFPIISYLSGDWFIFLLNFRMAGRNGLSYLDQSGVVVTALFLLLALFLLALLILLENEC